MYRNRNMRAASLLSSRLAAAALLLPKLCTGLNPRMNTIKACSTTTASSDSAIIKSVAEAISTSKRIVVMLGAGASVSAGIPDFRTPGTGLYDNLEKYDLPAPEAVFDIGFFQQKPNAFYRLCRELWPGNFRPTPMHYFCRLLQDKGKLLRVVSQNIDSLERITGLPQERIVAAHGNFDSATCIANGNKVDVEEVREAVFHDGSSLTGGWRKLAEKHGGLVKPDIVFFGEAMPEAFFVSEVEDLPTCDLLIIAGTSLLVHPFAGLVTQVSPGVKRVLINRERAGEGSSGWIGGLMQREALNFGDVKENTAVVGPNGDVWLGPRDCDDVAWALAHELEWERELSALIDDEKEAL